jgi:hypothetical protein
MRLAFIFSILAMLAVFSAKTQTITILDSGHKVSIRGLSVVDDNTIWISGSNGAVARSIDGGKTFNWQMVKGYEQRDFRDIEAFDANTAIIMGIAEPAVILKTTDGGQSWKEVFSDTTKGMFLDAMSFSDCKGVVIGDPINGKMFLAETTNCGETWDINKDSPDFKKGEAFFASSGTNIITKWFPLEHSGYMLYISGGTASNLFVMDTNPREINLPLIQGKESTGANSIDVNTESQKAVVVGGDFAHDKDTTGNCVLIELKDKPAFTHPQTPPHGYRSCVAYITKDKLITCGTSGVDISNDGGNNWQLISDMSFHVCQKAKNGTAVFLAGSRGKIARLSP